LLRRASIAITIAVLAALPLAGCTSRDASADRATRTSEALGACRGHGGVTALEDETVICADQTSNDERGSRAVDACRRHGGVNAFDDDIVICRDQTVHEAVEN
jgi:hypothetical protein